MTDAPLAALDALDEELDAPVWEDLVAVWRAYANARAAGRSPFAAAVAVAARADRLGQAFAVGYPAALEHLVPGVRLPCALCATEAGGNAPRAIETSLEGRGDGYRLRGVKTFVSFGTLAEALLVVARAGTKPDGRPDLTVVQIPSDRGGVVLDELPPTPFVPDIPHARVTFEEVEVREGERLPGDGYLRYVKPFRTIEDIHVVGATLGYLLGWSRRSRASAELVATLSSVLVALGSLRGAEPLDPHAHLALHGCYQSLQRALESDDFRSLLAAASSEERERWTRDEKLLKVASAARQARFQAANKALGLASLRAN